MGSNHYPHFSDLDLPSLEPNLLDFSSDKFLNYLDAYNPFPPAPPDVIVPIYPHVRSWDNSLQVPHRWDDTPTATNPSGTNTPLPSSDQSSDDNDLSRQVTSASKRKLALIDQPPLTKKLKAKHGHIQTAKSCRTVACLFCQTKTNKHRCIPGPDPAGPCLACLKRANALSPVICRRVRFQDVKIIRLGPSKDIAESLRWLKSLQDPQRPEWKRLTNLSVKKSQQTSQNYIELRLSQGHSTNTLTLRVQEFDPFESDKTSYPWYDHGVEHFYRCPNYAIADRDHATDQVRHFIDSNVEQYIDQLLPDSSEPSATFVRTVFQTALDRAHDSSLVALTLKFWVAGRFIEDPWAVRGHETLGMKLDPSAASPFSQYIPVTPVMNFQIDNIVIHDHLTTMLERIRKAMKDRIMPMKKEDWFDIHLATFILLHHVDLTMKHDVDFALLRNMSKRFSNGPLIEMITFSANALLSFHQHEKGHLPLSAPDWAQVEASHCFNDSQKHYLQEARRLIRQIDVPRNPGDDLFWSSQIYDSAWEPRSVEVVRV